MADPARQARPKRKKGKKRRRPPPPRGPAFTAHIIGHEVLQDDPLEVELIETGGPVHIGAALGYLLRHFPPTSKWTSEELGMDVYPDSLPPRRWSFGRGLTFTARDDPPRSEPIDMVKLGEDLREVSEGLAKARDGLNEVLRGVEHEMLESWPGQVASTLVEVWEGYTHHLTWDNGLFIDTSELDRDPRRSRLTSSSCRLRLLAVDELSALRDQLNG